MGSDVVVILAVLLLLTLIVLLILMLVPDCEQRFKQSRIGCSRLGVSSDGKHTCSYLSIGEHINHCNHNDCPILKEEYEYRKNED
jgi:hypothetical protein